ncbi:MAG: uracil-DNA glycosylase [Alphaproteobacteria bacterium PA2]|nr:MAG: uracil-DNA glycosylase [Alphaproteobacteria bacterium PA2]
MRLADATAESLLAFWAEAGIDSILLDEPIDRIAAGAVPVVRPAPPQAFPGRQKPAVATQDVSAHVEDARQAAQACQTLEELQAAISAFDGCPLKFQGAKQAVFSRGATEAPIFVVGEGPGQEEDQRGQPFVGRAGQLLDRMFAAVGITDRVFITNSVFWRPPGNRNPTPEEQAVCMPFVERAIALVQPRLLLCVGGPSSKAMLKRDEGILSLRGRWIEWRSSDGQIELPALATLHPAFLLRQPAAKKMAWADLLTLSERLDRPAR